jgi:uncharacterized membrane protein
MTQPDRVFTVLFSLLILCGPLVALADGGDAATSEPPKVVRWLEDRDLGPSAVVVIIAMLPILELRGSIPVAILYYKMPVWQAYILSVIGNLIPIIPIILLIGPVSNFLMKRSKLWQRFFTWVFERSRRRGGDLVEKYEAVGLAIFVAIPLPVTGAWTGSLLAFLMRVRARRAFPCILAGVLTAGVVVTLVTLFGRETFRIFIKM